MNLGQQALGSVQLALNECRVEGHLRRRIGDLGLAPALDLPPHRLEVTLDAVYSDRQRIDQIETLGVLGQDRREHA
jgi:hypothetical protein